MSIWEKLHSGELYQSADEELLREQERYLDRLYAFNHTRPAEQDRRTAILRELLAEFGEGSYIEPPFHANWGGHHLHIGKNVYANFNLTVVDDTHIYVGDYTKFGPNVVLAAAGHPLWPGLREQGYQFNAPIRIGRGCWLGAGVIVLPCVSIGDGTVIGAGSVVTRDIPPDSLAVGNPCRVLRALGEHDRKYYFKDRKIDAELFQ
ncbi:sugar O-acetyltransferase [uncultured Oscillibacter sp.]|uniref:sugar O-acetyltransferase n=1 Tax=uncultured Oscillibacter sp. TaxID=876091 RepID=UPI0025DB618E|nr:sugar O-acetyltransferase [uncultured Oscillibacter sp.]